MCLYVHTHICTQRNQWYFVSQLALPNNIRTCQWDWKITNLTLSFFSAINLVACFHNDFLFRFTCYLRKVQLKTQVNSTWLNPIWKSCMAKMEITIQAGGIEKMNKKLRASLVAQWLRICLPMQGTRVRALVWKDPTCRGASRPMSHNYWACASGACAPQQERPRWWEARAPRWRVAPTCRNWRKPSHRNEDPTQP